MYRGYDYEYGEKVSRLLAHQLKQQSVSWLTPKVKDSSNNLISDPQEITKILTLFHSTLYMSESPVDNSKMQNFLNSWNFPKIIEALASDFERSVDPAETVSAIRSVQSGKMPGPDGYSTDFYEKFAEKLSPLLLNMFQDSIGNGQLPPSLK